jgi:hypothetical protein
VSDNVVLENLRREGRVEAKVQVLIIRGRREIPLETSDVSFKGLFLRTEDPPPVRSLVRLRVQLPKGVIEAHAMAVHVVDGARDARRSGVGVQLWGLAGPGRLAWDTFIQDLLQAKREITKTEKEAAPPSEASPLSGDNPTRSGIRVAPIVNLDVDLEVDLGGTSSRETG